MNLSIDHFRHVHAVKEKALAVAAKYKERGAAFTRKAVGTVEIGVGAWAGGVLEGRTQGMTVLHVPAPMLAGLLLVGAGYADLAGKEWSPHLENFGNGFVASCAASLGHRFGENWFAGGLSNALHGGAKTAALGAGTPAVHGVPNPAAMAGMVQNMG